MEKDRLVEDIERSLTAPLPGDRPAQPGDPPDPYEAALADLDEAARAFERAGQAASAAERQRAQFPAPVLRPALRLAQFACVTACAAAHPLAQAGDWRLASLPFLAAFAAAAAGDLAGTGLAGPFRGRGPAGVAASLAVALVGIAAAASAVAAALFLPPLAQAPWFAPAVLALALASAATLPFVPAGGADLTRLEEKARQARLRQAAAFRAAREASQRLERIHADHLAPLARLSGRPAGWRRNANGE
ncbi:hypothetical protein [Aquibium microcysteis]|uniref:hypothetical protein n=1 Tax=Aquibium microcysteis TaxID=675281 RepID=UPI00165D0D27|nr:hypothetical protein [Aquibium microcysteis]